MFPKLPTGSETSAGVYTLGSDVSEVPKRNITEALLEISGCVQNQTFGAGQEKACTTCIKKIQILPQNVPAQILSIAGRFLGNQDR